VVSENEMLYERLNKSYFPAEAPARNNSTVKVNRLS
jgi:hypothetical protein